MLVPKTYFYILVITISFTLKKSNNSLKIELNWVKVECHSSLNSCAHGLERLRRNSVNTI